MSAPDGIDTVPPWSKRKLRALGESLRDNTAPVAGAPDYRDVIAWYDELALYVCERIRGLGLDTHAGGSQVEVTSRAKTIGTLTDKLRRDHDTPLSNVQDIAGVRVEMDMSLSQQDAVTRSIAAEFGVGPDMIKDLRERPHSGYRAVHVWLRCPAGHVEIQIRTAIQGGWANMYEALADLAGREIRYNGEPNEPTLVELVEHAQSFAAEGRDFEHALDAVAIANSELDRIGAMLNAVPDDEETRKVAELQEARGQHAKLSADIGPLRELAASRTSEYTRQFAELTSIFRGMERPAKAGS